MANANATETRTQDHDHMTIAIALLSLLVVLLISLRKELSGAGSLRGVVSSRLRGHSRLYIHRAAGGVFHGRVNFAAPCRSIGTLGKVGSSALHEEKTCSGLMY